MAVFRTFPWFFNSTDRLLEEQELTRKKEEYVAQLKSKLAQISVLISLSQRSSVSSTFVVFA